MRRGLNFRRVKALVRKSAIIYRKKLVPFLIMIRPLFGYENLVPQTKQALLNITRSIRITVIKAAEHLNFQNTTPITIIKEFAASVEISIPITTVAQEAPQSQLDYITIDRTVIIFIFQPVLNDATRIVIVKVELDSVRYETDNVAAYKTNDIFSIYMFKSQYIINVSLIHKVSSEGLRYNWPDNPQIVTRVINIYLSAELDSIYVI